MFSYYLDFVGFVNMSWLSYSMQVLPESTGSFTPGCADVMLDYAKDGVFMRLYYPTNAKRTENLSKRWYPWIPHDNYIAGIAKVIMNFSFFIRIMYWWKAKIIPVVYGAKIHIPEKTKLKCIILSHGLGGFRNLYSNICCELASRGFLVAAIEHRDESACYTYFYKSRENAEKKKVTEIAYRPIEFGSNHFSERRNQVEYRSNECSKTLDWLIRINSGDVPENVLDSVPRQRQNEFVLDDLVGNIDLDGFAIVGHSFGGATALLTLSKRKEFKCGILLDPWMFPIKEANLPEKIQQPLIFINTQTFHIATNVKAMSEYLTNEESRKMFTIKHTTHENQTDSVLVAGYWLNWFMKKLDPLVALRINNSLIITFLTKFLGYPTNSEDVSDCSVILERENHNIEPGLTKPWA